MLRLLELQLIISITSYLTKIKNMSKNSDNDRGHTFAGTKLISSDIWGGGHVYFPCSFNLQEKWQILSFDKLES